MKPLSGKLIEIFSLGCTLGLLIIIGISNPLDFWVFDSMGNSHASEWVDYLPGVWQAEDSEGNIHGVFFPNCGVFMPEDWAGSQSDRSVLNQGYQYVIGVQSSGLGASGKNQYVMGRGWSTSYSNSGYPRAWNVARSDERLALVTSPKGLLSQSDPRDREEIYLERVDENMLRSVSQTLIRDAQNDVLSYTRVEIAGEREPLTGKSTCSAQNL